MGYKEDDKCIKNAYWDERLFVLMARDDTAPELVVEWIKQNLRKQPQDKLREALESAFVMMSTRDEIVERKAADRKKYIPGAPGFCANCGEQITHHRGPEGRCPASD